MRAVAKRLAVEDTPAAEPPSENEALVAQYFVVSTIGL
jgi:hypothetical protein